MPSVNVNATAAVYVDGTNATTKAKNYAGQATFRVGTSPQIISYLYFNRPFPLGATITSARLEVTQSQPNTGPRQLDVRRVNASWQNSKITHNNRPNVTGASSSVSIGSGVRGRVISIDVTAHMQEISAGANWYGFRLYTDAAATMHFFNHKDPDYGPRLIVEYSTAPSKPTGLYPSGGRAVSIPRPTIGFEYSSADLGAMTAMHVQMNRATPDFTAPELDTGEFAWTTPQIQIGWDIAIGEVWFWRVKVKNASGEWSDWSDVAEFTRADKSALTITSPSTDPGVVTDPTPSFGWSFAGTQVMYRVSVKQAGTGAVLWDSGDTVGAETSIAYPDTAPALEIDTDYEVIVRVHDDVERATSAGDPPYVEVSRVFQFQLGTGITPATDLTASTVEGDPRVTLTWNRAESPDAWLIMRDGVQVANILGPDAALGGGAFKFVDLTAGSGSHTWSVAAVVNGVTSPGNPTVTKSVFIVGVWLMTLDGAYAVSMADGVPSLDAQEVSNVHLPLGAKNPVLITQSIFGRRGRMSGVLYHFDGATIPQQLAAWEGLSEPERYPRGTPMQLAWTDTSIKVFIHQVWRDAAREFTGSIPVGFEFCEIR